MSVHIDKQTTDKWQRIAGLLKTASDALSDAETILLLELGVIDGKPVERLQNAIDSVAGLSYLFTPQSEWCGNDTNGDGIFKTRLPHIAVK